MTAAPVDGLAADQPCWYGQADRRPGISRCPPTCNGECTHAERLGDGVQRFYCERHAFWRVSEVGRSHVRPLRAAERTSPAMPTSHGGPVDRSRPESGVMRT
jgi:hypothetical protein